MRRPVSSERHDDRMKAAERTTDDEPVCIAREHETGAEILWRASRHDPLAAVDAPRRVAGGIAEPDDTVAYAIVATPDREREHPPRAIKERLADIHVTSDGGD